MTDKTLLLVRCVSIAVAFLLGWHGIGHSMERDNGISDDGSLSQRDSLITEMVEFIQPEYKLSKEDRKHIEGRIKNFPRKILRRDTISHFLNTAYALSYYEFVKHDYRKAKEWGDSFVESAMPPGFFSFFLNYHSIGLSASESLKEKGRFKTKKDKNSWYNLIQEESSESPKIDFKRTYVDFIDTFLDDVPLDCSISTYRKLLSAYRNGGGMLSWLNGLRNQSFFQRCLDAGRTDILDLVCELWSVDIGDFKRDLQGGLIYKSTDIDYSILEKPALSDTTDYSEFDYSTFQEKWLLFNAEEIKAQIDSLVSVGSGQDLTPRIMRLLSQHCDQSRYPELVEACSRFEATVPSNHRATLHNYWALALSNLGQGEEALTHFDQAIHHSVDKKTRSTIRLNKGCTLGEMGRTEEAVDIFMSERSELTTPFEKFVWNDNLGYIYSFSNPNTALYYYETAERYLDSGISYLDRKIRHFCRKARVLEHNKFLQRSAIEKAFEYSRQYGCSDVAKGMAYAELAVFMSSIFDTAEAERLFQKAFDYYSTLEPSDLRMIYLNREYARNCAINGYPDDAVRILLNQLELIDTGYGPTHTEYAKSFLTLTEVSCTHPGITLNAEEVEKRLDALKDVCEASSLMFDYLKTKIAFNDKIGRGERALTLIDEALQFDFNPMQRLELLQTREEISRKSLTPNEYQMELGRTIPAFKTSMVSGLLSVSGGEDRAFNRPILSMFDGAVAMGAVEAALELSLFRKGLLFTKKRAIERVLSTNKDFKRLQEQRHRLNAAIAYNDSTHIPELSATVFRLERELANKLSRQKRINTKFDKTIQQVTEKLSSNDLAIEFVKYSTEEGKKYGAFLIDVNGVKKFISIGNEDDIVRQPVFIWDSIAPILPDYETVYFCPDGVLNSIGIEFLKTEAGVPVNHLTNLHRVFHLSEINRQPMGLGKQVFVVGVSDHNSPIDSDATTNRGNWTDLPNVEYEIQLVRNALIDYDVTVLYNNEVTEPAITALPAEDISTLHISTHGFYRDSKALNEAVRNPSSDDYQIARRFLSAGLSEVSGLVLRTGNISWQSPFILEEYDDLWTSEEIELMTFPSLNLTILSACDTGVGEIDSDGVWGLQRAFRIAGTKSLICSLTKIDDYWTAQFMDAFYEFAANGNTVYDSFQKAQKWLYHELPDEPGVWSSFILIE